MLELDQIILFASTALLLAATPGPDVIYVITRGLTQGGLASAMAAAAGFSLGNIVHTAFVILGVSAIIKASAIAFTAIKIAGAVYLIYIGIKIFKSGSAKAAKDNKLLSPPRTVFIQSVTANILNPRLPYSL